MYISTHLCILNDLSNSLGVVIVEAYLHRKSNKRPSHSQCNISVTSQLVPVTVSNRSLQSVTSQSLCHQSITQLPVNQSVTSQSLSDRSISHSLVSSLFTGQSIIHWSIIHSPVNHSVSAKKHAVKTVIY